MTLDGSNQASAILDRLLSSSGSGSGTSRSWRRDFHYYYWCIADHMDWISMRSLPLHLAIFTQYDFFVASRHVLNANQINCSPVPSHFPSIKRGKSLSLLRHRSAIIIVTWICILHLASLFPMMHRSTYKGNFESSESPDDRPAITHLYS